MKKNQLSQKKVKRSDDIATTVASAVAITGLRRETIKALQEIGSKAFTRGGRIDCNILLVDAAKNAELVAKTNDLPDIKLEKALIARVARREGEVRLEQTLQNIAPLDICRRILIRGGGMVRGKLMSIPDRVSEWCALETDGAKIRERLILELGEALKVISDQPVEKLIKDILADR